MKTVNFKSKTIEPREIPIFFAVDDHYAPYLAVAIRSLLDHASPRFQYRIYILIDQLSSEHKRKLSSLTGENSSVEYVNIAAKLSALGNKLHLRDYYTQATYYRFFIPELFPQYDRGLYLDCDIVVLGDISKLFTMRLGHCLLGAVQEEVMARVPVFGEYVERVLNIPCEEYFSAGILCMNLKEMRRASIEEGFVRLLERRKFRVTQDQDYLNVLCRGSVAYLGLEWNKTPIPSELTRPIRIVHYKINWKPWHYDGILYGQYFWDYAAKTPYLDEIRETKLSYTQSERDRDSAAYDNLVALAASEIDLCKEETFPPLLDFCLCHVLEAR